MISITCSTPDSIIRYTLDGNDPTETSTLYEGEFNVTPPTTVKARGFKEGWLESDVAVKEVEIVKLPTPVVTSTDFGPFDSYCEVYIEGFDSLTKENFKIIFESGSPYAPMSVTNNGGGNYRLLVSSGPYTTPIIMYITLPGYIDSDTVTVYD